MTLYPKLNAKLKFKLAFFKFGIKYIFSWKPQAGFDENRNIREALTGNVDCVVREPEKRDKSS